MKVFFAGNSLPNHVQHIITDTRWEVVQDQALAEVIFLLDGDDASILKEAYVPAQLVVLLAVFHIDSGHDRTYYRKHRDDVAAVLQTDNVVILILNKIGADQYCIYTDYVFDRQKLYCINFDVIPNPAHQASCSHAIKDVYALHPFNKRPVHKFLVPLRIYEHVPGDNPARMVRRRQIRNIVLQADDAIVSSRSGELLPHAYTDNIMANLTGGVSSWYPVSYESYDKTLISVYGETLVEGVSVSCVTEKTFDPLIKGNFILPFGYCGLINDILAYGFKLPNWIDYSYDSIRDDDARFAAYVASFKKLRTLDFSVLKTLAKKDDALLEHNKEIFFTRPYTDVYGKLLKIVYK